MSVTCDRSVVFSGYSTNKTDLLDITEILLKVAVNTITLTITITITITLTITPWTKLQLVSMWSLLLQNLYFSFVYFPMSCLWKPILFTPRFVIQTHCTNRILWFYAKRQRNTVWRYQRGIIKLNAKRYRQYCPPKKDEKTNDGRQNIFFLYRCVNAVLYSSRPMEFMHLWVIGPSLYIDRGPGWLNELGRWI